MCFNVARALADACASLRQRGRGTSVDGHLLCGAAFDAGRQCGGRVARELGRVSDVVSAVVDREVEIVALSTSAHGGVDGLSRHRFVDQDERVVAGGALGLVYGHGVAMREVTGFRVGEGNTNDRVVGETKLELVSSPIDRRHRRSGAVEDPGAVVVGKAEDVFTDGELPTSEAERLAV